ncbi:helix-turn-helix transcriptional regulator [Rhizobium beringeri]
MSWNSGDRLLAAREARGLNQTELAKASGLQPAAIGHFEKNRRSHPSRMFAHWQRP